MVDRKFRFYDWEAQRSGVVDILDFVLKEYPFLEGTYIPIKAYQTVEHGQIAEERVELISTAKLSSNIKSFRYKIFQEQPNWTSWQTGLGGVFYRNGKPESFLPMIDLELLSTPDLQGDINQLEISLNKLGVEGGIVKSGDTKVGGYFFVGHKPIPFEPYFWSFLGKTLQVFTVGDDTNTQAAKKFGWQIEMSNSLENAKKIALEVLNFFPSIKTGTARAGLLVDPRWIAHRIIDGYTILRFSPGKNYMDIPLQIVEFCIFE